MNSTFRTLTTGFLLLVASTFAAADDPSEAKPPSTQVYGQWSIRPKPDQGPAYNELIEQRGLPLFRSGGGRMVGWWNTLVGNQYEQLTIWEYDSMAAYERAVASLGANPRFTEFARLRDPLLAAEESQFLTLAEGGQAPKLPETAPVVIHEVHQVPLKRTGEYLRYMKGEGRKLLASHGFHPIGPLVAEVGKWNEVTYLFPFQSLAERERLRSQFAAHADAPVYGANLQRFVENISTRVLVPAPLGPQKPAAWNPVKSSVFAHLVEVVPGVYAAGFADRHKSANCGWVALRDETLLIDLPRGVGTAAFLAEVTRLTGKPPRTLLLTSLQEGDAELVSALVTHGIKTVVTTSTIGAALAKSPGETPRWLRATAAPMTIDSLDTAIEVIPLDAVFDRGGAAVHLAGHGVVFAGPLVVNGPHPDLASCNTERWIVALERAGARGARYAVPGFGSWAAPDPLSRQLRFLSELRRQVGYVIAQGRPKEHLQSEVHIGGEHLVWAPYDGLQPSDLERVWRDMTVPAAPFNGIDPRSTPGPHALVLYADLPHEPGNIIDSLPSVFESTGVTAHFTVDVRALTADNLKKVDLLVILRDGLQRPKTGDDTDYVWMTQEQQDAVVHWVHDGGSFLNLHNSMGLYPASGGYLELVGGAYTGHGPLERFRVEVVDREHPVTRGVSDFSVADEQHTPVYDKNKVHLLLQNRSDDGTVAAAGWAYEPGKGRLCHLANGHTREALSHPMYQRLMKNAINWCLRRESEIPR